LYSSFNQPSTTELYTLPLHDALPICTQVVLHVARAFHVIGRERAALELVEDGPVRLTHHLGEHVETAAMGHAEHDFLEAHLAARSEEHTSELQSRENLVCRLLLEKKK